MTLAMNRHGALLLVGVSLLFGCEKDKFTGPEAEVKKTDIKVDLPTVPDFSLPVSTGDQHSVKELRVKGKKLLDSTVTVKGVVTWAYDCPTAVRAPGMSDKDLMKKIDDDPSVCERPKFYIGDAADTPAEKSLWVVDVPRPYYKVEIERLPKDELKNPPPDRCDDKKDPKHPQCPIYKVGDVVTITGDFKQSSTHSERNSDGLLVYKSMHNETENWDSPVGSGSAPGAPAGPAPGEKLAPDKLVAPKH
jgi:hypothetical protein